MSNDPKTPDEWQTVVDAADGLLLLDAARQFGLLTGGPVVNAARCEELLGRGFDRGVFPTPPDRRRAGIAHWLRRECRTLGVSQRRIARESGLNEMRVSLLARGRRDCDVATLERLREAIERIRAAKDAT